MIKTLLKGLRPLFRPEAPTVVFEGESAFHRLVIRDENGLRTLYFIGPEGEEAETSIDLADPNRAVFEYPGLLLTALLQAPGRRILLLGLGGGYLPGLFARHLPDYEMTVAEVDPLVAETASLYFGFRPGANIRLVLADGRDFLENQPEEAFDHIWLDAFSGDYVPGRLSGLKFLELCRSRLAPGGLLAQNCHQSRPRAFQNQLKTAQAVFGSFWGLEGRRCGNAVIMTRRSDGPEPAPASLLAAAKKFGLRLGPYDLTAEIRKFKIFKLEPGAEVIP